VCLALPHQVIALRADGRALVDLGGIRAEISIALVPEAVAGDYVIVHVGYAIGLLDAAEAAATLQLFADIPV
jgi:hydrogenase expression/formation protein HypC